MNLRRIFALLLALLLLVGLLPTLALAEDAEEVTVTLMFNGAVYDTIPVRAGEQVQLPPFRSDDPPYRLIVWTTQEDGGGSYYEDCETIPVSEDLTLYAQAVRCYRVTVADGVEHGTVRAEAPAVMPGETCWVTLIADEGYYAGTALIVQGDADIQEFITAQEDPDHFVEGLDGEYHDASRPPTYPQIREFTFTMPEEDVVVGGQFYPIPATCTITFRKNIGRNEEVTQTAPTGSSVTLNPNPFSVPGYAFVGWTTSYDGDGTLYADGAEVQLPEGAKIFVLYAKWKKVPVASELFLDLPDKTDWAYEGIDYCVANGYMNGMGEGTFQPNGTTTRAQLVTILWRMSDEPKPKKAAPFTDAKSHWAKDAIAWAAESGIVNGVREDLFDPDAEITREQLVTIFHRYCKDHLAMDVSQTQTLEAFPDARKVSSWAKDAMQWAAAVQLITGVGTSSGAELQPQGSATRAQIARVIMNYCVHVAESK